MREILHWVSGWFRKLFPNPEAVAFALFLTAFFLLVISLGQMLMPVFAAGVIAYLLDGVVSLGVRKKIPRSLTVLIVYVLFLTFLSFLFVALLPSLYKQTAQLIGQLPAWLSRGQGLILQLPAKYPDLITEEQLLALLAFARGEIMAWGQSLLTYSYASLINMITLIVYTVLVPMLVFFFLKDKDTLILWITRFLPSDRYLSMKIWMEVDTQIGNYVRGKMIEVLVLFVISYLTFWVMDLNYALLLASLMGVSVIIPYVGATLVTFPVLIVGFFQWGASEQFGYLILAYSLVQATDAIILIPLLFSEVVNLHPIAIIVAILFFGGLWGFWGVFFAIPLATLVKAILNAWPRWSLTHPPNTSAPLYIGEKEA